MIDIEKVLKGLECCTKLGCHHGCEYKPNGYSAMTCRQELETDALELLKEQDRLLGKQQKGIDKLQADYALLRHKFLEKTQIVRCKDCKHFEPDGVYTMCYRHNGLSPNADWYCADGERK